MTKDDTEHPVSSTQLVCARKWLSRVKELVWDQLDREGVRFAGSLASFVLIGGIAIAAIFAAVWFWIVKPNNNAAATECHNKCAVQHLDYYTAHETSGKWFCYCTDGKRVEQIP